MLEVSFFVSFISKVKTQLYVTFERHMRTYKCSKRIYSLLSLSLSFPCILLEMEM